MSNLFRCRALATWLLAVLWLAAAVRSPAGAAERVVPDLLVLYTFERPKDNLIRDQSGVGEPLNLRFETPQGMTFRGGRLIVTSSVRISSLEPARKIVVAVKQSNALSIEAWVKPDDARQAGPARIVSLSADPGHRNFTLGQDAGHFDVRLRTTSIGENGVPSTPGPEGSLRAELSHVVYTRDSAGSARIYLNGKEVANKQVAGELGNWSEDFRLTLANELTGDRPWLGELHLVAIYGRALTEDEVARNFSAGTPTVLNYAKLLPPANSRAVDFVNDVQPLLRQRCFECHAAGNEEGGLNLGIRQRVLEGGEHGPVLVPGDSANSRLIHLVAALEKQEVMPPEGQPLSAEEVGLLRAWIDQGAKWPDGADVLDPRSEQAKGHWAFQPLRSISEPAVHDANWGHTPIDRFILARLESAGIRPQGPVSSRQLIRRVAFDLVGLPPSPEEVRDFTESTARDPNGALAALVDRLLNSPHYGERWGRHWLDVARYADSDGQESDADRPQAYHFRDFVIRAFNEDLPFDQFVRWQLAGDEYEPQNPAAVAATGFLTAGPFAALPDRLMEDERLRERYNELDDMLSTVGTGFMGLTLGCARCHDHKYDAIPSRDYYRMMCALHSGQRGEVPLGASNDKGLGYRDLGPEPKTTWLFQRGNYYDRDQPVQLGFVFVLTNGKTPDEYWKAARDQSPAKGSTNQRRALADWITDVDHGAGALVARVIVNRLWQHHFGQGLVRTVGDFGVRAEPPTHPELLEWLAHDLVQNGWRIKRLQKLILTSAVYQQASKVGEVPAADPDNRLLWRMPLQRLEGEILRDSLLAVSGTLNAASYGPAVKPPIASEAMLARNLKDPYPGNVADGPAVRRRSVYLFHKRVVPYPLLQAFDKPDAQQSCGRRDNTTVAPQALALLNDQFVRKVAFDFADRLLKDAGDDLAQCVNRAYLLALARAPSDAEQVAALAFVEVQIQERTKRAAQVAAQEIRRQALADLCQTMFSLNEFFYID
jgi:hypothetical protein